MRLLTNMTFRFRYMSTHLRAAQCKLAAGLSVSLRPATEVAVRISYVLISKLNWTRH